MTTIYDHQLRNRNKVCMSHLVTKHAETSSEETPALVSTKYNGDVSWYIT